MPLTKRCKERLEAVAVAVLEEPRRLHMGNWRLSILTVAPDNRPSCNTVACVAGWVVALELPSPDNLYTMLVEDIRTEAIEILGISPMQADRLFHADLFPRQFSLFGFAPGTQAYAERTAARIYHFIATEGNDTLDPDYIGVV